MTMTRDKLVDLNVAMKQAYNALRDWNVHEIRYAAQDKLLAAIADVEAALAERALEPQGQVQPVAEVFHYEGITYAELREPITVKPGDLLYASQLALPAGPVPEDDALESQIDFAMSLIKRADGACCDSAIAWLQGLQRYIIGRCNKSYGVGFQDGRDVGRAEGSPAVAQPASKREIFAICNAYESGYGHGLKKDGLDLSRTPHSDPDCGQAYQIGYEAGVERAQESEAVAQPVADEREASDAYFKARHPMLDTAANRNVFSAGFRAALCQPAEEKKPHEWSTLRRGYFDVFNDDGTVYATVFNSLEALSYLENGWRVEEQKPGQPAEEGDKV